MSQVRSDKLPFLYLPLIHPLTHPLNHPLDITRKAATFQRASVPQSNIILRNISPSSQELTHVPTYSQFPRADNMNAHNLPESSLSIQRREWLATEMDKNREAFTNDKQLTLLAGTWNVNGRAPEPNIDITPWLFPNSRSRTRPIDIYMLGLQEVQPLTGVDAVRSDTMKGIQWRNRIQAALGSDYEQVAERQLVGIMVMVYIRKNHLPFLSNVQLSYAATGFLNALGNKGGVAARFQLYDQTLACVTCHLAAHTAYVDRRTQDFTDVVRKAVFLPVNSEAVSSSTSDIAYGSRPKQSALVTQAAETTDKYNTFSPYSGLPSVTAGTASWLGSVASVAATAFSDMSAGANTAILNDPNALRILDHNVVFWLGDLNYRIDAPLSDVVKWTEERNWNALYRADQLQQQMKSCDIFRGFEEGQIKFPPTYKLERYGDKYALDEAGEVKRVPAYTDRILWRVGNRGEGTKAKTRLKQQYYHSAPVYSSDHRPVFALFSMTFGVEDIARKTSIEAKINRELDRREAAFRPSLQFSPSVIDFGDIFFDQENFRRISIRNLGAVTAFVTINAPHDVPKWLVFDFSKWRNVEILPGKSAPLHVGVLVKAQNGTANALCAQGCVLNMTLNIMAEPGALKEKVQIRGKYVATTLGLSLETLSMLSEPVFALRSSIDNMKDQAYNLSTRDFEVEHKKGPSAVPLSIPKELWLLVDALMRVENSDDECYFNSFPDLFVTDGCTAETQRVLSFIDRGEIIPKEISGYAIGSCMLDVLKNLDDSVIPKYASRRAIEAGYTEDPDIVQAVVDLLPPINSNVFWYIIGFLCETPGVQEREDRRREIASVFGKVLLSHGHSNNVRDDRCRTAFVLAAIRQQQQKRNGTAYKAVIDLAHPITHPKKVRSGAL